MKHHISTNVNYFKWKTHFLIIILVNECLSALKKLFFFKTFINPINVCIIKTYNSSHMSCLSLLFHFFLNVASIWLIAQAIHSLVTLNLLIPRSSNFQIISIRLAGLFRGHQTRFRCTLYRELPTTETTAGCQISGLHHWNNRD